MPLDYDEFLTTLVVDKIVDLSATTVALCLSVLTHSQKRYYWSRNELPVSDADWDEIEAMVALANGEIMASMVGMIVPHAMGTISAFKMLPCDGGVYLKDDYPLLYDVLDSVYIISGTQFSVPDMRDRVAVGTGNNYILDDSGGVDSVVLTEGEIPSHSHTTNPHTHTSIPHTHLAGYPTPGINTIGPGVPDPLTVGNPPVPTTTSPASSTINTATVTVNSTGNDEAHENRQPYRALNWAIIAS